MPLASDAHGCANAALAGSDGAAYTSLLIIFKVRGQSKNYYARPELSTEVFTLTPNSLLLI